MVASRICGCAPRKTAVASSADWPRFSRTMTVIHHVDRLSRKLSRPRMSVSVPIGITTSNVRPTSGPKNSGGVTPTIVNGTLLMRSDRPSTSTAPPNRRCQNA
jgi:hypothetical protein